MSLSGQVCNILWATSDYKSLGSGYDYHDQIKPNLITGDNGYVIMPRVLKSRTTLEARIKNMAEVFTPAWVCNAQNNQIDEQWFGRKEVFNKELLNKDGTPYWIPSTNRIEFSNKKTWRDYVRDTRLEITCGEAPYLVSRYDAATGQLIPLEMRIGLLDRKLRVVSENTYTVAQWLEAAEVAFKSIYAYEWQGDSLLIARESLLFSFIEYFKNKFERVPDLESVKRIAYIISWNLWQMDGLKGVIPDSCHDEIHEQETIFGDTTQTILPCEGCTTDNLSCHNGTYCYIMDWFEWNEKTQQFGKCVRFVDLM